MVDVMTNPTKPWRTIPIAECGEPLFPIPHDQFLFYAPHPYQSLGAPYGGDSPWRLRQSVLVALIRAQELLRAAQPGWSLLLFDAWRPNTVQAYMVEREFRLLAEAEGWDAAQLTEAQREQLAAKVFRIWGIPSDDPATPPPHSTGAVVDLTLADAGGREVAMGSPIDENSDRSNPDFFANARDPAGWEAHLNRQLLNRVMTTAGFCRHHAEWWHFSLGDQYWAWVENKKPGTQKLSARFGMVL